MKKTFFLASLILVSSFMVSCSNVENAANGLTQEQYEEKVAAAELRNSIAEYNAQRFGEDVHTRGFFKWLLRAIVVVSADVIGGTGGGIVGGVAASGSAGLAMAGMDNPNISIRGEFVTRGVPVNVAQDSTWHPQTGRQEVVFNHVVPEGKLEAGDLDSIGYYHNKVLYKLFSDKKWVESAKEKSQGELMQDVIQELVKTDYFVKYYGEGYVIKTQEVADSSVALAQKVIAAGTDVESEDEFLAKLGEANLLSADALSVLGEFLRGLSNITPSEDDGTYFQEVLDMIDQSNLSDEMKKQLSDGVIIGQASNHLWTRE